MDSPNFCFEIRIKDEYSSRNYCHMCLLKYSAKYLGLIKLLHKLMSKSSPESQGKKTPSGRKTYNVNSIQIGNGNGTKKTRKKRHLQINKNKKGHRQLLGNCVWLSGACISKND